MFMRVNVVDGEHDEVRRLRSTSPAHNASSAGGLSASHDNHAGSPKSGIIGASFNLINTIIGAGVVGLPAAVEQCGLVAGFLLLVLLAAMMEKSLMLMIESGIKEKKKNLEDLCLALFGAVGYYVAALFMFCYSYGSMVACMMVIGDTIPLCLNHLFDVQVDRAIVMVTCAVLIIMPLCCLRDMASLSSASFLSFCGVVTLVLLVCIRGPMVRKDPFSFPDEITVMNPQIFMGIGTISFHYVCQQSAFLVFGSMENETIAQWESVALLSMLFGFVLSITIGIWGYLCFPEETEGNILNNFSDFDTFINVARFGMAINMIFTFPVECFVVRHAVFSVLQRILYGEFNQVDVSSSAHDMELSATSLTDTDTFAKGLDVSNSSLIKQSLSSSSPNATDNSSLFLPAAATQEEPIWRLSNHLAVTLILWSSAVALSLMFQDLTFVLQLSGIIAGSMLGFIIPSAVYIKSYKQVWYSESEVEVESQEQTAALKTRLLQAALMCAFGFFAMFTGLLSLTLHHKLVSLPF